MTKRMTRVAAVVVASVALGLAAPAVASAQSAKARYTAAKTREDKVRRQLAETPASAPAAARTAVITEARSTMAAYEALVRIYVKSGYADNALFNAGSLAEALYAQYGLRPDRDAALRYYRRLRKEYPHASLGKQAAANVAALERAAEPRAGASGASGASGAPGVSGESGAPGAAATPAAAGAVNLRRIERTVLPEAVRVTLELDREVPYFHELIAGPARLFFDLKGVDASPDLLNSVLRFPSDVVRQIRLGKHPGAVRVVLDFEEVARHSVYTLYNPFRIVIDAEGAAATSARSADSPSTPPPTTSPVAPAGPATVAAAPPPAVPPPPKAAPSAPMATSAPPDATPAPVASAPVVEKPVERAAPVVPKVNGAGGFSIARQLGLGVSRIVIDPGHGGHDPGAQVRGVREADLTLDIALRLEKLLLKEPGLEVVLTRREDVYVPLEERTAIANREGADLFLSIHANTSRNTAARGIETYYLSFAGSPDAEAVAARENSAHAGEMHRLPDIIKAIALNNKLDESRDLAGMVQEALVSRLQRSSKAVQNRGVKKAPFVVLIGAEMPSVLAEVSFMSNRQELALLKTNLYKQRIADALHAAVMRYRRTLKGVSAIAAQ